MFVYCIDRLVCFILIIVMCNIAHDVYAVTAQTNNNNIKYIQQIKNTKDNEALPSLSSSLSQIQKLQSDNIGIFQSEHGQQNNNFYENDEQQQYKQQQQQSSTEKSQNLFWPSTDTESRNPILDSIFNIPITTLQAVSELVQNIVGVGRSFISGRLQSRHQNHHISPASIGGGGGIVQYHNQDNIQIQNSDNNHE